VPDPLLDEVIEQMELWAERAEYWRAVACELASGRREKYPWPHGAEAALRHAAPRQMDWRPGPSDHSDLALRPRARLHWWATQDSLAEHHNRREHQ
jgi:hypothetical protein